MVSALALTQLMSMGVCIVAQLISRLSHTRRLYSLCVTQHACKEYTQHVASHGGCNFAAASDSAGCVFTQQTAENMSGGFELMISVRG